METKCRVVVGGFANSIELFELIYDQTNVNASKLIYKSSNSCAANPAFLATVNQHVYAVHENLDSGDISYFKLNDNDQLQHIASHSTSGAGSCHIDINPKTCSAFISNYHSGHFVVLKLEDWVPVGNLFIEKYEGASLVNKERQECSHPHGAFLYKNFVYVCDLGNDKIWQYKQENAVHGAIVACKPPYTETPPGSGPRHMAFSGNLAFVLMELFNEVLVYKVNGDNGELSYLSSYHYLENLHKGKNYGAEIMVHPNGNFVYLSNRINGCLVVYKVVDVEKGGLERIQCIESGGTWPRHFTIHESGRLLVCADQFKDELTLFSLDDNTGCLSLVQTIKCENKPSSICFS